MNKVCTICGGKSVTKGMCQKHYDAARYSADPEKNKAQHRRFIANNPGYLKERYLLTKPTLQENQKRYRANNKERVKELERTNREKHKEKKNSYSREYRAKNLDWMRKMQREWVASNPAKHCARVAARNAAKRRATPVWANDELDQFIVEEMYDLAERRTKATGFKWSVDHMVPLKSKTVCGLHCSANLQVIPHSVNQKKGNRTWPNMP